MVRHPTVLAIDQGTTSSRAVVFDTEGEALALAQQEFPQIFPRPGWVEHDPGAIWSSTRAVARRALREGGGSVAALGITNQRETTVVWDRRTAEPVYNAIVWQDRRTADACRALRDSGFESTLQAKTGLLADPYFSATKLAWILDHIDDGRRRARRRELAFGTIDTYLIWQLTGGAVHATDATNASRTALFNIHAQRWDEELLDHFDIPLSLLPQVRDCADDYGVTAPGVLGAAIPIRGVAGDQQAAALGQACLREGMAKSTYGTGCFLLVNTGERPVASRNRLLTTTAYRLGGQPTYALEGSIFIAGAAIQWLRDGLALITDADETEAIIKRRSAHRGVYLVPAFTGLGAPYWDPDARAAIYGLTRDADASDLVRAAVEAVAYQTRDLVAAMQSDGAPVPNAVRVDGGMTRNDWMLQFLADQLGVRVDRPRVIETTALGAAYLAALGAGIFSSTDEIATRWKLGRRFHPSANEQERESLYRGWRDAVDRTLTTRRAP